MTQSGGIESTGKVVGDLVGEIGAPFGVIQIVIVKLNSAIVNGVIYPVFDRAIPLDTRYRAQRQINRFAV